MPLCRDSAGRRPIDRAMVHRRRIAWVLLLALLPLTLSCMTTTISYKVNHNWKAADTATISVGSTFEVPADWAAEAKKANKEIEADCKAAGVPMTDTMRLPETFADLRKLSGGMLDMSGTDEAGTVTTELPDGRGINLTKTMTLDEYAKEMADEGDDAMKLTVTKEGDATRYVSEFTIPGLSQGDDDEAQPFDWAKWDEFVKSKPGPKPKCVLPASAVGEGTPTPEPQPTPATPGLSQILFPAGSDTPDSAASDFALGTWYTESIFRKTGYPTWLKLSVDLPGEVVAHTMNGQTAGVVQPDGSVLFAIDEAFLRKNTFKGPWTFRVETLVTEKMQKAGTDESRRTAKAQPTAAPKATQAPSSARAKATVGVAAATAASAAATAGGALPTAAGAAAGVEGAPDEKGSVSTSGMARFRIRQLNSYALGLPVGASYATYELQEMEADGTPGRLARLRYMGYGPAISIRIMPRFLQKRLGARSTVAAWTEFEAADGSGHTRLEDLDGIKGHQTNTGTFWQSWTAAVFGTAESADEGSTKVYLTGTQLGLYAGVDATTGTWKIVGEIRQP